MVHLHKKITNGALSRSRFVSVAAFYSSANCIGVSSNWIDHIVIRRSGDRVQKIGKKLSFLGISQNLLCKKGSHLEMSDTINIGITI